MITRQNRTFANEFGDSETYFISETSDVTDDLVKNCAQANTFLIIQRDSLSLFFQFQGAFFHFTSFSDPADSGTVHIIDLLTDKLQCDSVQTLEAVKESQRLNLNDLTEFVKVLARENSPQEALRQANIPFMEHLLLQENFESRLRRSFSGDGFIESIGACLYRKLDERSEKLIRRVENQMIANLDAGKILNKDVDYEWIKNVMEVENPFSSVKRDHLADALGVQMIFWSFTKDHKMHQPYETPRRSKELHLLFMDKTNPFSAEIEEVVVLPLKRVWMKDDVECWDCSEVLSWIRHLGMSHYCKIFLEHDIDGAKLLDLVDEHFLLSNGVSRLEAKEILQDLEKWQDLDEIAHTRMRSTGLGIIKSPRRSANIPASKSVQFISPEPIVEEDKELSDLGMFIMSQSPTTKAKNALSDVGMGLDLDDPMLTDAGKRVIEENTPSVVDMNDNKRKPDASMKKHVSITSDARDSGGDFFEPLPSIHSKRYFSDPDAVLRNDSSNLDRILSNTHSQAISKNSRKSILYQQTAPINSEYPEFKENMDAYLTDLVKETELIDDLTSFEEHGQKLREDYQKGAPTFQNFMLNVWNILSGGEVDAMVKSMKKEGAWPYFFENIMKKRSELDKQKWYELFFLFALENKQDPTELLSALFQEFTQSSQKYRRWAIIKLLEWWVKNYGEVHFHQQRDRLELNRFVEYVKKVPKDTLITRVDRDLAEIEEALDGLNASFSLEAQNMPNISFDVDPFNQSSDAPTRDRIDTMESDMGIVFASLTQMSPVPFDNPRLRYDSINSDIGFDKSGDLPSNLGPNFVPSSQRQSPVKLGSELSLAKGKDSNFYEQCEFNGALDFAECMHQIFVERFEKMKMIEFLPPKPKILNGYPTIVNDTIEISLSAINMSKVILKCGFEGMDAIVVAAPADSNIKVGYQLVEIKKVSIIGYSFTTICIFITQMLEQTRLKHGRAAGRKGKSKNKLYHFQFLNTYAPNRTRIIKMGENIHAWIASDVLSVTKLEDKTRVYTMWYRVLRHLQDMNSYDAMYWIILTLMKTSQLDSVWQGLCNRFPDIGHQLRNIDQSSVDPMRIGTKKNQEKMFSQWNNIRSRGGMPFILPLMTRFNQIREKLKHTQDSEGVQETLEVRYGPITNLAHEVRELQTAAGRSLDNVVNGKKQLEYVRMMLEEPPHSWELLKKHLGQKNRKDRGIAQVGDFCTHTLLPLFALICVYVHKISTVLYLIYLGSNLNHETHPLTHRTQFALVICLTLISHISSAVISYGTDYGDFNRNFVSNTVLGQSMRIIIYSLIGLGPASAWFRSLKRGYHMDLFIWNFQNANKTFEFYRMVFMMITIENVPLIMCYYYVLECLNATLGDYGLETFIVVTVFLNIIMLITTLVVMVYTNKNWIFRVTQSKFTSYMALRIAVFTMICTDFYLRLLCFLPLTTDDHTFYPVFIFLGFMCVFEAVIYNFISGVYSSKLDFDTRGQWQYPWAINTLKSFFLIYSMVPHFCFIEHKYWLLEHAIRLASSYIFHIIIAMFTRNDLDMGEFERAVAIFLNVVSLIYWLHTTKSTEFNSNVSGRRLKRMKTEDTFLSLNSQKMQDFDRRYIPRRKRTSHLIRGVQSTRITTPSDTQNYSELMGRQMVQGNSSFLTPVRHHSANSMSFQTAKSDSLAGSVPSVPQTTAAGNMDSHIVTITPSPLPLAFAADMMSSTDSSSEEVVDQILEPMNDVEHPHIEMTASMQGNPDVTPSLDTDRYL